MALIPGELSHRASIKPGIALDANETNRLRGAVRRSAAVQVKGLVLHRLQACDHRSRRGPELSIGCQELGGDALLADNVGKRDVWSLLASRSDSDTVQALTHTVDLFVRLVFRGFCNAVAPHHDRRRLHVQMAQGIGHGFFQGIAKLVLVSPAAAERFAVDFHARHSISVLADHLGDNRSAGRFTAAFLVLLVVDHGRVEDVNPNKHCG